MTTGRSAPKTGYDFGRKRAYRRTIWATMRSAPSGPTLIMPSIEGDEIREAEARGVRRHDLHVVDRNPAIVAHIQRRFPGVTTYGVELARAAERMAKNGTMLAAMNLDLTGPIGAPTLSAIIPIVRRAMVGAYSAITLLRGREQDFDELCRIQDTIGSWWYRSVLTTWCGERSIQATDYGRLLILGGCLAYSGGAELIRCGSYRSTAGQQTMLWSVWRLRASEYWIGEVLSKTRLLERANLRLERRIRSATLLREANRLGDAAEAAMLSLRRCARTQKVLAGRVIDGWREA